MSNRRKTGDAKPEKSRLVPVLAAVAVVLGLALVAAALAMKHTGSGKPSTDPEATATYESGLPEDSTAGQTTAAAQETVQFPYTLEDDGLEITSLFQYSGNNPDCGWAEGTGISAVILRNDSGRYLETLDLTVVMDDGTELSFAVSDIPHGKTVWAFERENKAYDNTMEVTEIRYETKFREGNGLVPDQVTATVDGMNVTLTNVSGETLTGLEVRCHDILDGVYFGGTSYTYPVAEIPVDESAAVFAADCVMGEAGIARVDYKE